MQRLPVGIDDFAKIREGNYYFVDKTMAIGELLDNHGEVLLLTRPRRFGKTLFLSMLYYFLASARGADYRNLFHGLAIERADGGSYMAEQGRRPVPVPEGRQAPDLAGYGGKVPLSPQRCL